MAYAGGRIGARAINVHPERISRSSLSFSGCGFLCIYHCGVAAAIKEYAPQMFNNQICGASAGAIVAAGIACNVCISEATSIFLSVVSEARSYTFGAMNRDFDLMKIVREKLDIALPPNAHDLCSGRIRISVTRIRDMENVILSDFNSKEELLDAICCSCFIPVYGGFVYPTFRGEAYIDGGASDNQPVADPNTITVSPFSGESDICPSDDDSANLFEWNCAGTSIRLTCNNLYRAAIILFPPSTEECARICRSGYQDALKFLINNGFASNTICLSVEAELSADLNEIDDSAAIMSSGHGSFNREQSNQAWPPNILKGSKSVPNMNRSIKNNSLATRRCGSTSELPELPAIMQSAFNEAMQSSGILEYIFSFRIVKLARYITLPVAATVQLWKFCRCLSAWLARRISKKIVDDWISLHIKKVADFIMKEIYAQEAKVSARLSQQLAITEIEFNGVGVRPDVREQFLDIKLSADAEREREQMRMIDKMLMRETTADCRRPSPATSSMDTSTIRTPAEDTLSQVIEHTQKHDGNFVFYYVDRNNTLRVCEIYDIDRPDDRSTPL